jgi:hypothetical protein
MGVPFDEDPAETDGLQRKRPPRRGGLGLRAQQVGPPGQTGHHWVLTVWITFQLYRVHASELIGAESG